jgi:PAS domain S-box-containing protein
MRGTGDPDPPSREELIAENRVLRERLRLAEAAFDGKESAELRQILELVPGGIVHVGADGSIRLANDAACELLGLRYDEITRMYTREFEHQTFFEDGSPCPLEAYPVTQALATGERAGPRTIGVLRHDGRFTWAVFTALPVKNGEGTVEGAVVTFLDMTQRYDAEAKLRSLLASLPNLLFMTDLEGKILETNRVPRELEGRRVVGNSLFEFVNPREIERLRSCMAQVMHLGETGSFEMHDPPHFPGAVFSVNIAPVKAADRVLALTYSALDVTKQKRMQSQLMVSDRMASVGTLAAGVAHEINNPLTYMTASLSSAIERLSRAPASSDLEACLGRLRDAAEGAARIRDIVRDLGTFSRGRDTKVTAVDVHLVLESAIRMSANELKYRARVVREYGDIPRVLANESRLGQVVLNLLVNAGQAIEEGNVEQNEIHLRTFRAEDGLVVIEVEDTGAGIPEGVRAHVFEPFVTTKAGTGTGLGLYICHSIVRSLGGEISVESRLGQGTKFSVRLPAATHVRPEPSERPPPASLRRLRILVVDDEPGIRRLVAETLRDHNVDTTSSGREALRRLEHQDYDIVLCDLIMPDLTGMDVYERQQEERPERLGRFVFMTGGAFTPRAQRFVAALDNDILQKPFQPRELLAVMARVDDRARRAG